MLFLDDADLTYISKDKEMLNMIIKNHSIEQVTFLFFFEILYLLVNFIFEERMCLSLTQDRSNCRWLVKTREKNSEGKFDYCEKMVEMNQVLISALKSLGFLGAMSIEWHCIFHTVSSRAYNKHWRANISLYRFLYTYKLLEFVRDN